MRRLYTIGYEGASLDRFLDELQQAGVNVLVDVRELPLSRRKGFSKTPLSDALKKRGIGYVHQRELGAPKDIRHKLRETGDYASYFHRFAAYLSGQHSVLRGLIQHYKGAIALMCYERDPTECHRSVVARELGKMASISPVHLRVEESHGAVRETARLYPGQGLSAA